MFRSFRRSHTLALGLIATAALSGPALAEALPGSAEVCAQWASRGTWSAARSAAPAETCRLPARLARRGVNRIALAAAQPDAVFAPMMPAPSRHSAMLILGVGY